MAKYVDGFVIAVPKANLDAYKKMAKDASKIWKKYGALDYVEAVGEDMEPEGMPLTFPKLAKLKEDEVVVFSYITYKSKAQRNKVNKQVMADPAMKKYEDMPMPFNMKRMAFGGFETMVAA